MSTTGCASTAAIVCLLVCFGGSANAQTLPTIELSAGSSSRDPCASRRRATASRRRRRSTRPSSRFAATTSPSTSPARRSRGSTPSADPDQAAGVGIRVDGGRNVRIANAQRPRLQGGPARARHARPDARSTTTSATTGSRGCSASWSTRASSIGCRYHKNDAGRVAALRRRRLSRRT